MLKQLPFVAILSWPALVLVIAVSYCAAQGGFHCKQPQHESPEHQAGTGYADSVLNLILSPAISTSDNKKAEQREDCNVVCGLLKKTATDATAFFTLVLCYVVYLQFVWLTRQERVLTDSIDVARKEFIASHRPKIAVRNVEIIAIGTDPGGENVIPTVIGYSIANTGDTAAHILRWNASAVLIGRSGVLPPAPPYIIDATKMGNTEIGTGEHFNFFNENILGHDDWFAMNSSSEAVFIIGFVTYADQNGRQFHTAFCRKRDGQTERFILVVDPDYEYQD